MTAMDWFDLMREAGLAEQEWQVIDMGPGDRRRLIRNKDGYCPLCALALATESIREGMRNSYVFALRAAFGWDLPLDGAHDIAEAADLPFEVTIRSDLLRAELCRTLNIPQESA